MPHQIKDLVARIEKLEKTVYGSTTKVRKTKHEESDIKSLSDHIMELRDRNFFKQPMTAREVYAKLKPTYPCEPKRVGVEIFRLQQKKLLRKTSKILDQKKLVAYVW